MRAEVITQIEKFLKSNKRIFFNENEFQMYLAIWLKKEFNVFVEYKIEINGQKWYLDIVVEKGGVYLPIELKYKTTNKYGFPTGFKIFNTGVTKSLENQGAHNNGCYDFWYDVVRIEQVPQQYSKNVELGIAVLLTNDYQYWTLTDDTTSDYYDFRLKEGRRVAKGTTLKWGQIRNEGSRQGVITISHNCTVNWCDTPLKFQPPKGKREERFRYLILPR